MAKPAKSTAGRARGDGPRGGGRAAVVAPTPPDARRDPAQPSRDPRQRNRKGRVEKRAADPCAHPIRFGST